MHAANRNTLKFGKWRVQTFQTHSTAQVAKFPQRQSALTELWMQRKVDPSPLTTRQGKQNLQIRNTIQ